MVSYVLIMLFSLWLNRRDKGMLLLTLVVSGGIFLQIPDQNFYKWCIFVEVMVCIFANVINVSASRVVIWMSISLIVMHYCGYKLDGYPEDSPYHILVKICEHAELASCILLSRPSIEYIFKDKKNVRDTNTRSA